MAAIAKFISYDGGIAFSDSVLKFQKREGESRIIPLEQIASVGVRRSQQDPDGFIRIQLRDGKKYRLFFAEEQLKEALQFKKQLESILASIPAPEENAPVQQPAPSRPEKARPEKARREKPRREKQSIKYEAAGSEEFLSEPEPEKKKGGNTLIIVLIVLLAVVCVALGVLLFIKYRRDAAMDAGLLAGARALGHYLLHL